MLNVSDDRNIRKMKLDALVEQRKNKQSETNKAQVEAEGERGGGGAEGEMGINIFETQKESK